MQDVILRPFTARDTDWLVERHATLYAQGEGFDDTFGPLVRKIAQAFLDGHDPERERGWIAARGETRLGSIFCMGLEADTAQLRLFLLEPEARGAGLGRHLLESCTGFARGGLCPDAAMDPRGTPRRLRALPRGGLASGQRPAGARLWPRPHGAKLVDRALTPLAIAGAFG